MPESADGQSDDGAELDDLADRIGDHGAGPSEAVRVAKRIEAVARLADTLRLASEADLERTAAEVFGVARSEGRESVLLGLRVGTVLLELQRRAPHGLHCAEAELLVPGVGESSRAELRELAERFLAARALWPEIWAAGSLRAALAVACTTDKAAAG